MEDRLSVMLANPRLVVYCALAWVGCAKPPAPIASKGVALASTETSMPSTTASAAPTSTHPPPYDLAADILSIRERATKELGEVNIVIAQTMFVLIAAPGWNSTALANSQKLTIQAIDAYFSGRFDHRPERAIAVYLFADATRYQNYCKRFLGEMCPSEFGVYYSSSRSIVMNAGPGLGTLTHELIHPILESDFPNAPIWINEGIASLFEAPVIPRPGEIHGVKNWRLPRLLHGFGDGAEIHEARLDALFGMSDETFRNAREKLHYATARYVCQWLDAKGLLWPFYRAFRDHFADDPTGELTFTRVVGSSPSASKRLGLGG